MCFLGFATVLCVFVYESGFAVTVRDNLWLNPLVRYEQCHILHFSCYALYCPNIIPQIYKLFYVPPHKRVLACLLSVCQACCASPGG